MEKPLDQIPDAPVKNEETTAIKEALDENHRLIRQNNHLLRKLNRIHRWSLIFKVIWFFIFIGAPFVVYYWLLEPYFSAFGSSFSVFEAGLQEIPGWKQFYDAIGLGSSAATGTGQELPTPEQIEALRQQYENSQQ